MASKNTAVFGIYPSREAVEEATVRFHDAGFRPTDVSALFPDNQGTKDLGHEKNSKAPEGFSVGVTAGGVIGGVLGYLVGIGSIASPELAPLAAAGPVIAAMAGVSAIGVLGGLAGAVTGMAMPEYEAKRFAGRIRKGGVLASVHCDDSHWARRAREVMEQTGARDIAAEAQKSGDFGNADKPLKRVRPVVEDVPRIDRDATHTL